MCNQPHPQATTFSQTHEWNHGQPSSKTWHQKGKQQSGDKNPKKRIPGTPLSLHGIGAHTYELKSRAIHVLYVWVQNGNTKIRLRMYFSAFRWPFSWQCLFSSSLFFIQGLSKILINRTTAWNLWSLSNLDESLAENWYFNWNTSENDLEPCLKLVSNGIL